MASKARLNLIERALFGALPLGFAARINDGESDRREAAGLPSVLMVSLSGKSVIWQTGKTQSKPDTLTTDSPPYRTAFTMSKIGRYMATIMPPTTTPRNTIMMGSSRLSSALTAASTSSS